MSAGVTRRALVASVAAIGASAAGVAVPAVAETTAPASDPDVDLLALIERHPAALAACVEAEDAAELRGWEARAAEPPCPDALRWRPSDFPRTSYGRGASDPIGDEGERRYGRRGVEWLRKPKPAAQWTEEAEGRRREIVEAHDRWSAERHEVAVRTGLVAAEQVKRAAVGHLRAVEGGIIARRALTTAGLRAKALWVADHIASDPYADEDLGEVFAREVASFGGVGA